MYDRVAMDAVLPIRGVLERLLRFERLLLCLGA